MFLFRERFSRNEKFRFVMLKDTVETSGRKLLKAIVKALGKEEVSIYFISYEKLPEKICDELNIREENFHVFDAFTDPFFWTSTDSKYDFMSPDILHNIPYDQKSVVIIDSLSPLLIQNSIEKIYRSIHKLLGYQEKSVQLVALLHSDIHSKQDCFMLETLTSTLLKVLPSHNDNNILSCTTRYTSGKASQQMVHFKLSDSYEFIQIRDILQAKSALPPTKQPDPTANLTFNLKIRDDEKEVRDKLQMPYTKVQTHVPENSSNDLLEDDFYDEDDPDDDLIF